MLFRRIAGALGAMMMASAAGAVTAPPAAASSAARSNNSARPSNATRPSRVDRPSDAVRPKPDARRKYVALGDSYAAGYGLPAPATPTRPAHPGCEQTSRDYPRLLARRMHLALTDATCSGATTADFHARQATAGPDPRAQLRAVRAVRPDVVTITIGGNDLGFAAIARTCLAATPLGPLLLHPTHRSCRDYYRSRAGAASNPLTLVAAVRVRVQAAIAAVQQAAPRARIVVTGYPAIAPDARHTPAGGCYAANTVLPTLVGGVPLTSAFSFTNRDVPFLAKVQRHLNRRIKHAARHVGATYVDVYGASLAHSACAPESTRWVEPLIPGGGGTNVLHPSLPGTVAMAAALRPTLRRVLRRHG